MDNSKPLGETAIEIAFVLILLFLFSPPNFTQTLSPHHHSRLGLGRGRGQTATFLFPQFPHYYHLSEIFSGRLVMARPSDKSYLM